MRCDICGIDYAKGLNRGVRIKIVSYEEKQGRFTKKWRIIKKRKNVFVCRKCVDILNGLVINYRRNSR